MNIRWLFRALVIVVALFAGGCASIISGRTASVEIDSRPSEAQVVIRDKHGKHVLTTQTPANVELKRKDRFIWPARYTATIQKQGYEPKTVPIRSTINPWVAGNLVFGGPIGLVVDNATGAAWQPKVASINEDLEPIYTAQQPESMAPGNAAGESDQVEQATAVY